MRRMFKAAVPLAMAGNVLPVFFPDGKSSRGPQHSILLVPNVENLTRPVANEVIRPWRELVLPAVHGPRGACTLDRHLETK